MSLQEFITPETIAIFVIAFVVIFVIFLSIMTNKILSLDHRVDDLTHSITRSVGDQVTEMKSLLHADVASSRMDLSSHLEKMGDSWRNSLDSSVSNVRSEILQFKGEVNERLKEFGDQLASDMGTHGAEMVDRIGRIRDSHSSEVSQYHKMLLGQMNEHAAAEQKKVSKSLTGISEDVDASFGKIGSAVSTDITEVGEKVDNRVRTGLEGIREVFQGFAGKVDEISATRERIDELSRTVESLTALLDDRRSRGAIGEVMLNSLISDLLSPSDYEFNARLDNGATAECLLKLPEPTGHIAISSRIDISDLEQIVEANAADEKVAAAREEFAQKLQQAIETSASELIVEGQTGSGAVLLLPSETAFTEAYTRHRKLVDLANSRHVWIASPSSMIALISIARTAIKDAQSQLQAQYLDKQVNELEKNFNDLYDQLGGLAGKVDALNSYVASVRDTTRKIAQRFDTIGREAPEARRRIKD